MNSDGILMRIADALERIAAALESNEAYPGNCPITCCDSVSAANAGGNSTTTNADVPTTPTEPINLAAFMSRHGWVKE